LVWYGTTAPPRGAAKMRGPVASKLSLCLQRPDRLQVRLSPAFLSLCLAWPNCRLQLEACGGLRDDHCWRPDNWQSAQAAEKQAHCSGVQVGWVGRRRPWMADACSAFYPRCLLTYLACFLRRPAGIQSSFKREQVASRGRSVNRPSRCRGVIVAYS